ncbi:MAG: AAA family ATPase [Pseudoxanthomonas suwonensis]|nr:AAA family ATPase [Pseudoxanthomonas suwonensis]
MPIAVTQVELNGETVTDFDPPHVTFEDQEQIISEGLKQRGWTVTFLESDKATRRRLFKISKGSASLSVITYIFPNLAWSSGGRSHEEKRIQLSRPYAEHAEDFTRDKNKEPRCALMGIYRRNGLILFCAWDPAAYAEHSNPSSCYVRTDAMASAAQTGFGQGIDTKKRFVCCFTPDLLAYYLENLAFLHDNKVVDDDLEMPMLEEGVTSSLDEKLTVAVNVNKVNERLPRNRIFYGAPGTGKSHNLDLDLKSNFPDEALFERTTFYPDYTSGTFLGSYRPTPIYRGGVGAFLEADRKTPAPSLEPMIDYRFVPGPFLRLLAKALNNPEHNFCLVIEEINRANASAVFADAFQMLDRDEDGNGKFAVTLAPESMDFLASMGHFGPVRIPANLYVWASMNSADQGVTPLDSAFKRRWSMEYVGIDEGEDVVEDWELELAFLPAPIKWNKFRQAINNHLVSQGITEDRLLGPFFMTERELSWPRAFEDKLLLYLRDDVVKNAPSKLFTGGSATFGALVKRYRQKENIFVPEISFSDG